MTCKGILSRISSIYDPLGFVPPYALEGKKLVHQLCQYEVGSDATAPDEIIKEWQMWYKTCGSGKVNEFWIHHFSDVSEEGYGKFSFLMMVNCDGAIHCKFVMGKSRVTFKKCIYIPRLELVAATLSVKMAKFLRKKLNIGCLQETFWSHSKVVLGYIRNTIKNFKVFVANTVQQIYENSEVNQWKYVPSKDKPTNHGSCGLINANSGGIQMFKLGKRVTIFVDS